MLKPAFKTKLAFAFLLIILIPLGFAAIILDRQLEDNALKDIKLSLFRQTVLVAEQVDSSCLIRADGVCLDTAVKHIASLIGCRLTIVDRQGKVMADSEKSLAEAAAMENHLSRPEIRRALSEDMGQEVRYSTTLGINMLYTAVSIKTGAAAIGVVRTAVPLENVNAILRTTRRIIVFSMFLALCLAVLVGAVLTGAIVEPLNRIIYVSRKFAQGDFKHRIYHESRDEIGELSATLNAMAQDIESKIGQIQVQNQQLSAIFQTMVEGIIVVDRRSAVTTINPSAQRMFDLAGADIRGRLFLEAFRNNDIADIVAEVLRDGQFVSREMEMLWPVKKTLQVNAAAIYEQGAVSGCLLVIHDITRIRNLETVRTDFVANVSHELKTPLTSIKGFVETLIDGGLEDTANARHFLQIIQDHTDRLSNLVNDLLDLSRLESKSISLEKESLDLKALVDKVMAGFCSQSKKKEVCLRNDIPSGLKVEADISKIEQVLTNLIDNAIKFNRQRGSVVVSAEADSGGGLRIAVEDSGAGIPARDIPRIFERFYRVDKARSRELGGTGLGLAIVKHIVSLHGGSVGVSSTEGLGSQFWFTLPR